MEKELLWIVYLVDGSKKLLTDSEFKSLCGISKDATYPFASNMTALIDGLEMTSAVREDCSQFVPHLNKRVKN